MKHRSIKLAASLSLLLMQPFTQSIAGNLFKITASGTPANVSITLCLNAIGKLSCQNYTVTALSLLISPTITGHTYKEAGIRINTPGYTPSVCTPIRNGFCLFTMSESEPKPITLGGSSADSNKIAVVGSYRDASNNLLPLGYTTTDQGNTWSASSFSSIGTDGYLYRASCSSDKSKCSAVGLSNSLAFTYISSNGGTTWTPSVSQPTPPIGTTNSLLKSVSCDSSGNRCISVGTYYIGATPAPLAYSSNNGGNTWTVATLPAALAPNPAVLNGVACDTTGNICSAVGNFNPSFANQSPLVYYTSNGGATWSKSASFPLHTAPFFLDILLDVACDSTGVKCRAVGTTNGGPGVIIPLTYISGDSGQTWTMSATQPPVQGGSNNTQMNSIACDSTGNICTAVGSYNNPTITAIAYYSTDGGNTWQVSSLPLPPAPAQDYSYLNVVTCDSTAAHCIAGGTYFQGSDPFPLTYTSSDGGITWALSTTLPQTPAGGNTGVIAGAYI